MKKREKNFRKVFEWIIKAQNKRIIIVTCLSKPSKGYPQYPKRIGSHNGNPLVIFIYKEDKPEQIIKACKEALEVNRLQQESCTEIVQDLYSEIFYTNYDIKEIINSAAEELFPNY